MMMAHCQSRHRRKHQEDKNKGKAWAEQGPKPAGEIDGEVWR